MIEACAKAGIPLFVAYYRRTLPYFLKVKELLCGKVTSLQINLVQAIKPDDFKSPGLQKDWRTLPEISGGGYFHDLASHQLDLLEHLLGEIAEVSGHATIRMVWYGANDIFSVGFAFKNGVIGTGLWNFTVWTKEEKDEIIITGWEGFINFSTFNDKNHVVLNNETGKTKFDLPPYPTHVQQPLIQTVVYALSEEGKCPSNSQVEPEPTF